MVEGFKKILGNLEDSYETADFLKLNKAAIAAAYRSIYEQFKENFEEEALLYDANTEILFGN